MRNPILVVSGTLWVLSVLAAKSCSTAVLPFFNDKLNGGETFTGNGNRFVASRDTSQTIIARSARDGNNESSKTPKFNYLILIIPCVLGVCVIILIVMVVCYMRWKSGRASCISIVCLIWCGLMKRGNPSSGLTERHRSTSESGVHDDKKEMPHRNGRRDTPVIANNNESAVRLLPDGQHLQTRQWVEREGLIKEYPSEKSPNRPETPNTGCTSLTTDDEDLSPNTTVGHQSGAKASATKFRYLYPGEKQDSIAVEKTRAAQRNMNLNNIPENENIHDMKDCDDNDKTHCGLDGVNYSNGMSSLDDEVFHIGDVSSGACSGGVGPMTSKRDRKRIGPCVSTKRIFRNSFENGRQTSEAGTDNEIDRTVTRDTQPLNSGTKSLHGNDHVFRGKMHQKNGHGQESEMERLLPTDPNRPTEPSLHDTKSKVIHENQANQEGQRQPPRSAPPEGTHTEITSQTVYVSVSGNAQFDFKSHVNDVQIGNREINNNFPRQIISNNSRDSCTLNRFSPERQTC